MSREDHWYIPGKLPHEKQHIWEHKTLQVLAQYADNGDWPKFEELLSEFNKDKQGALREMFIGTSHGIPRKG